MPAAVISEVSRWAMACSGSGINRRRTVASHKWTRRTVASHKCSNAGDRSIGQWYWRVLASAGAPDRPDTAGDTDTKVSFTSAPDGPYAEGAATVHASRHTDLNYSRTRVRSSGCGRSTRGQHHDEDGGTNSFQASRLTHGASMTDSRPLVSVVDDDESVRESLPDLLREFGFAALAFASAEEFLASNFVAQTRCLVLDLAMPGMSGQDLQRQLM